MLIKPTPLHFQTNLLRNFGCPFYIYFWYKNNFHHLLKINPPRTIMLTPSTVRKFMVVLASTTCPSKFQMLSLFKLCLWPTWEQLTSKRESYFCLFPVFAT